MSAAAAQNVVDRGGEAATVGATTVSDADVGRLLAETPDFRFDRENLAAKSGAARRVAAKLERHVAEFVAGYPLRPFHHTHGISGYEAYFDHPDELFFALSLALPLLSEETRTRAENLLDAELAQHPPYAAAGFDRRAGSPRESYDVPEILRIGGRGEARDVLGVYAFWAYVRARGDAGPDDFPTAAAREHWPRIAERIEPLVAKEYEFDVARRGRKDDAAERLTGDAAGLVGFVRLAQLVGDAEAQRRGRSALRRVLELRVNLDRVNPDVIEATPSTTAHLHAHKLARYCRLVPEVAAALAAHTDGVAARRLASLRAQRNGWHVALGDRWIGGENYTSPPHFARALFAGAALVERLDGEELLRYVDVPICAGDLYFIERSVLALRAAAGRPTRAAEPDARR